MTRQTKDSTEKNDKQGEMSAEDIEAISKHDEAKIKETGRDHSTENYEESEPTSGVGAIQNHSDTTSDIARIKE
jgi:hypothetical protein